MLEKKNQGTIWIPTPKNDVCIYTYIYIERERFLAYLINSNGAFCLFVCAEKARGVFSSRKQHLLLRRLRPPPPLLVVVVVLLLHVAPPVHLPPSHVSPLLHLISSTQAHLAVFQPTFPAAPASLAQIPKLLHSSHAGAYRAAARLPFAADRHSLRVALLPGAICVLAGAVNQVGF